MVGLSPTTPPPMLGVSPLSPLLSPSPSEAPNPRFTHPPTLQHNHSGATPSSIITLGGRWGGLADAPTVGTGKAKESWELTF